ncbi:hypothetical protein FHY55_00595 [Oceanicola sp. D3]|uniref:hypothetical protein n=1 Tax=Oceanicola sp. D3 TaxID=2587163 RepID=UPI001122B204|nr:hypothetical protein [Oceanicola sp. D3]QDC07833.1 hypothetical protein FHY55_00595 [Oceanicola sp. D3]
MSDGIEPHLKPNETLLWQGRPTFTRTLPGAYVFLRITGWVMFACFLFFLLIGLANLDEMEGGTLIWVIFLAISSGLWLIFSFFAPAYARAANRRTRYGVTKTRALILHGGHRLIRLSIGKSGKINRRGRDEDGPWAVYFFFPPARRYRDADGHYRTSRPGPVGFTGLSAEDAVMAETALTAIRGKG